MIFLSPMATKSSPSTKSPSSVGVHAKFGSSGASRFTKSMRGAGTPTRSSVMLTLRRSSSHHCSLSELMRRGERRETYASAFSSGNPFEWKQTMQSTTGHSSTGAS